MNVISHLKLVLSGNYGPDISLLTLGWGTRIKEAGPNIILLFLEMCGNPFGLKMKGLRASVAKIQVDCCFHLSATLLLREFGFCCLWLPQRHMIKLGHSFRSWQSPQELDSILALKVGSKLNPDGLSKGNS